MRIRIDNKIYLCNEMKYSGNIIYATLCNGDFLSIYCETDKEAETLFEISLMNGCIDVSELKRFQKVKV